MTTTLVRSGLQYAWRGPSLLIVSDAGSADVNANPLHGFYYCEARFLSRLVLTVNGQRPWLCECAAVRPDLLSFAFVYPEITSPGGGGTGQSDDGEHLAADGLPERAFELNLTCRVRASTLIVRLAVTNRSRRRIAAEFACQLDADFADLIEAQAQHREQTAAVIPASDPSRLSFVYQHPRLPYRTDVETLSGWSVRRSASDTPAQLSAAVSLDPQQSQVLEFVVVPRVEGEAIDDADARERAQEEWAHGFTRIDAPGNRLVQRILENNIRDIASLPSLTGPKDEWLAMHAGMPLYPAFFGRDAVTAGWQAALVDRGAMLEAAFVRLGRMQSDVDDAWTDAEPGRIPYQMRTGPLARLRLNPYSAYYADYASPLMYVIALANLYCWSGDIECVRRHWDTARRIMEWARERGDRDGDGYLEYLTRSPKGTKNQGWKDSGDAIVYDDGSAVPAPIATCELQGYWYIAQELMAVMSGALGERAEGMAYHRSAAALKERFNRDWWMADAQFIALALDPDKRPVRALTSNVGHCLATGIIDTAHLQPVVDRLFAPDLFSGWGIRTLSAAHAYYDPLSYHRGSVWAVEQGTIVFGLRRFGFEAEALTLSRAMFDLAELYPEYRVPECVGGYARDDRATPSAYPRANTPQLWNATALPLIVQSLLGLLPLAPIGTLVLDPVLPEWLPSLELRGLRVGEARVTLSFRRDAHGRTDWEVLHQQGKLRIVRQPPPESTSATVGDRLWGLVESLTK